MNLFERYLTVWVAFCIVIGVALGQWFPDVFQFVGRIPGFFTGENFTDVLQEGAVAKPHHQFRTLRFSLLSGYLEQAGHHEFDLGMMKPQVHLVLLD